MPARSGKKEPFTSIDLHEQIEKKKREVQRRINELSNDEILANEDSFLFERIYNEFSYEPVTIYDEDKQKRTTEPKLIKMRDLDATPGRIGYIQTEGIVVSFYYPYEGDYTLFDCRATAFSITKYPTIELIDLYVVLKQEIPLSSINGDEDIQNLEYCAKRNIERIKAGIEYANNDAVAFNSYLRSMCINLISNKRAAIQKFYSISEKLQVPVHRNDFAETHIPIQKKRSLQPLKKTETVKEPNYFISDNDYADILSTIKHFCSTFETTPSSYKSMHEEDLRNVLLALLNASYNKLVTGETFRVGGKTDIQIKVHDHAAFVGECKIWTGPSQIEESIIQLDHYLTWRDVKTSLIFFVRRERFIDILSDVAATLKGIAGMISVKELDKNEFACVYSSKANPGQRITVRVFLFNLMPGRSKR